MSNVTEHELNVHKDDMQKAVDFAKAVERLHQNPDFKKVIHESFLLHEAARFAHASTDFNLNAEQRADALANAQAGGYLKRFLHYAVISGRQADNQIRLIDQELESIRTTTTVED